MSDKNRSIIVLLVVKLMSMLFKDKTIITDGYCVIRANNVHFILRIYSIILSFSYLKFKLYLTMK